MLTAQDVKAACEKALQTMRASAEETEIAFFGGSFTAIERDTMVQLLQAASLYVKSGMFGGIRLSTRPDAIDDEVLSLLAAYGVTTIELGAQSMNDRVLQKNGRGHTALQVETAARLIKNRGFSLGLQMMTGLPEDDDDGAMKTARCLAALQPDFVRIYPTLVMENTQLAEWYRRGEYRPQTTEEAIVLCSRLLRYFEDELSIPVIRLGLHSDPQMCEHCLAGPFHPAFRERCESYTWLHRLQQYLDNNRCENVRIIVHPSQLSKVIGQKKENIDQLRAKGYAVVVTGDSDLCQKEFRVEVIE